MADNIAVTEGAGKDVATDDVGGKQYQRIKLDLGTDGAAAPALAGAGVVATGVQRVTLASDDPAVTALQIIDDWDDANYCNVNLNIAGTDISANAGVLTAQTLRVTIATDDEVNNLLGTIDADTGAIKTAVELLDNAVDGNYLNCNLNIAGTDCVGNAGVLAAGVLRVTIATDDEVNNFLGAIDADTSNMATSLGNLDNAVDGNYLNVNLNIAGTDCDGGSGAQGAQTLRVILATNDPAVALLTTIDSDTNDIKTALEIIDDWDDSDFCNVNLNIEGNDVTGGEGTIDAQTLRVTIATDDDGVAHLATIAGDTTAIEAAVEIMDDWDATHASAAPADGAQVMGTAYSTALPTDVGADADAARLVTDRYGRLCTGLQPQAAKATLDNADTTTAREVVGSTASRKIYVTSLILSVDTAGNYWLEDGDATQVTGKFYLAANGGVAITFPEGTPLNTVTQNKALNVKGSTAGNVSVTVTYYLAV